MKKLALLFLIVTISLGLSAAKIHKVGGTPKMIVVSNTRYTISEFENASGTDTMGRSAVYGNIEDAITALDGRGGIVQVENETPVYGDLTIPSNVMLILPPTGVFNVAATKTLTINCQVQGMVTNTGAGSVAYGTSYSSPTSFPGPVHEYYVDNGRTDSYTADGSITRPYSTIKLALDAVNADVIVHGLAGTGAAANYRVHVGAGTYSDNLTITGPRYLRIDGSGVVISGTILINSLVGSYDHIEFVGQEAGYSEKGPAMTLSGAITCTRTNDSLIYVNFKGCYVTSNLATVNNGTWVLQYDGCRVNGTITGTFSVAGMAQILLITNGWNEFAGAISGKVAFYDANGSDFYGAISTTPYYASKFKGCSFSAAVSIIPVSPCDSAAITLDGVSWKSLKARTPTLTGATVTMADRFLASKYELYVDGDATYTRAADGSMLAPYSTILAALTAVNADSGKSWVIHVAPGTYSDNLTITGPRHLRIEGEGGVTISGTIAINSGVGAYDRIEFVGTQGGRSEKGPALTISGAMTFTRSNDSLIYVGFHGCYITGALATVDNGTWVLQYRDCRVNGTITGTFSGFAGTQVPSILIEAHGFNEFVGTVSGIASFYNCNGADIYSTINTTPYFRNWFTDTTFAGAVTIAPLTPSDSALIYIDGVSLKSLVARTPTLTGATYSLLESVGSETNAGINELSTNAEAVTGTATDKVLTPGNLTAHLAAPKPIGATTANTGAFTTLVGATSVTSGVAASQDPIAIISTAKGTAAYTGTITTTGDLTAARTYQLTDYSGIFWTTGLRFARPHIIASTAWSSTTGKNDGSTNYVIGSSVGPITYREEQNKTTKSWKEVATGLDISADDTTDNEGVEIYFADGVNETLGDGWLITGSHGGTFEVVFTIANVSATDQFLVGWRSCVAFDAANDYTQYVEHIALGITATDGSVFASSRVPAIALGAQQTDDSGTNLTDATSHTLRVTIDGTTRIPTAYLDGVAVTLTNCGGARTTATAMAPFITYIHGAEAEDAGIIINRISIWR